LRQKANRRRIPRALKLTRIKAEIRQETDMLRGVDLA
jgi:hypothetical protein